MISVCFSVTIQYSISKIILKSGLLFFWIYSLKKKNSLYIISTGILVVFISTLFAWGNLKINDE